MLSKKIFFIIFIAFLIRLIALNQSLWLDEAVTANVVKNLKFSQIVSKFSINDFHPPFYYLFMKLWTNVFGYSEIALRMPSVIFSLATGYVVYLIAGIWSAVFFLFNPLIVYYSQEARMYMMVTFFLTVSLYYFLKNRNIIFFILFIFLSLLTFYSSAFLITAFLVYFLYKKQYKNLFACLLIVFIYFLIISPLLYQQLINSKIALSSITNWSSVLGKANIKNLLLIPVKFSIGRISFEPKWLYWSIAGVWTGFVLFTIRSVLIRTDLIKRVLYLLIFPLGLGFILSFFIPMLQYFRFIYLISLMSILQGINQLQSRDDRSKIVIKYVILFGFIIFLLTYLFLPQFHREDWKSLTKSLPKGKPVYMIMASSDPITYYNQNLIIKELKDISSSLSFSSLSSEIIVIPYTADIYGLDYKNDLKKIGYQLKREVSFREVAYEQWFRE